MVGASFGLSASYRADEGMTCMIQKVKVGAIGAAYTLSVYSLAARQVSKEQELGLSRDRKKFDIKEEYFRLSAAADEDWEPKRIQRPKGLPEWGVPPTEPTPKSNEKQ
ncbi:hypothetical protein NMY22_g19499 [Coprinellus aureogranulatus]|nr:hypothetical protein NMY22_g19499 [Coprinellus aureogranulatus]